MTPRPHPCNERGSISLWVVLASFCMILIVGIAGTQITHSQALHFLRLIAKYSGGLHAHTLHR